jgi:hypothetical protein
MFFVISECESVRSRYKVAFGLLGACNALGFVSGDGIQETEGVAGSFTFIFIEPDLYSDPFSYGTLALAGHDCDLLLNAPKLTKVTQAVTVDKGCNNGARGRAELILQGVLIPKRLTNYNRGQWCCLWWFTASIC